MPSSGRPSLRPGTPDGSEEPTRSGYPGVLRYVEEHPTQRQRRYTLEGEPVLLIGGPQVLARMLPRRLHHPVDLLKIKPPLLLGVGFAVTHQIIAPDRQASGEAGVAHGPADCPVKGCVGLVPGTGLDTGAAAGAVLVPNAHGGAFANVGMPVLVAIVHHLPFVAKALGRTFPGALLTLGTEILQPEIDRFVDGHGQISRHNRRLEPGSHERMEHRVADPAHLPQTCPQRIGGATTW